MVVLAASLVIVKIQLNQTEKKLSSTELKLYLSDESLTQLKTKDGLTIAENNSQIASLKDMNRMLSSNKDLNKGITPRGVTTIGIRNDIDTTIPLPRLIHDSIPVPCLTQFEFTDKWYHIAEIVTEDSAHLDLSIFDSLVVVPYTKRVGIWRRKVYGVRVETFNPHTTFTGLKDVQVAEEKKHAGRNIGIGASAALIVRGVLKYYKII